MATDNPFWTFSLTVYAVAGVAPACLRLQDRLGLDVNLMLYCCWTGRCGIALDAPAMAGLLESTADWTARVVQPLRVARRALKDRFAAMPEADRAALRTAVAKLELEAERIEQLALAAASPLAAPTQSNPRALIKANLERYFDAVGIAAVGIAAVGVEADSATPADIARLIEASADLPA